MLGLDAFSGAAFVFRAKRADRVKILVWDRTGLVLVHKRLEGCKFVWPQVRDGVMRISPAMFAALFEGLDWRKIAMAYFGFWSRKWINSGTTSNWQAERRPSKSMFGNTFASSRTA